VLELNVRICNKYQVQGQLSLAMKATHMHYGTQNIVQKHGNSQLKVQELHNYCHSKRLLLLQIQENFKVFVIDGW